MTPDRARERLGATFDRAAAFYQRAGGHLAFWNATHVFPDGGDPFFRQIQGVYNAIGEGLPAGAVWPRPGELPDRTGEIEANGLFGGPHPALRLGTRLGRRRLHRAAQHLLRPHRHGGLETRAALHRDPPPSEPPSRRCRQAPLGCGAARRPPPRPARPGLARDPVTRRTPVRGSGAGACVRRCAAWPPACAPGPHGWAWWGAVAAAARRSPR